MRFAQPDSLGVRAAYTGDTRFAGSRSSTLEQTIRSSVKLHGASSGNAGVAKVRLGCAARSGGCRITAVLRTTETVRGEKQVVSARARRRQRTVVVAIKTVRIAAGRALTVTIKLNRTGRKLLARFKRLPVKLTITLTVDRQRSLVATRKLTLKRRRGRTQHRRRAGRA